MDETLNSLKIIDKAFRKKYGIKIKDSFIESYPEIYKMLAAYAIFVLSIETSGMIKMWKLDGFDDIYDPYVALDNELDLIMLIPRMSEYLEEDFRHFSLYDTAQMNLP